jgi:hypothetical protein
MLSARSGIPEAKLAVAVIHRALEDALTPDARLARPRIITTKDGPRTTFTAGLKPRDRDDAVRFLLDPEAGWAASRAFWCDLADLHPEDVRRQALKRIPPQAIPASLQRLLRATAAPVEVAMPMVLLAEAA